MTMILPELRTYDEVMTAVNNNPKSLTKAVKELNKLGGGRVTIQWLRQYLGRLDNEEVGGTYDRAREVVRSRNAMAENTRLRKDVKALSEAVGDRDAFLDALARLADELPDRPPINFKDYIGSVEGVPVTVEVLLSDLQIGKLSPGYNTNVARKRLFELGRAACFQIEQKITAGYCVERIVLGLLGDIIESDKKHKNSARATDSSTSEQMFDAQQGLLEFVIEPLARYGIPLDVIAITGNHDHDDHGINMFEPGKNHLSWCMYRSLELITTRLGYTNTSWTIPDGSYAIVDFYGQKALYEHGVGVSATEAAMKAHKIKRSEQERQHLTYFRMGDKHTVTSFNSGQLVVNGAFFGASAGGTEYSGIAGFSSVPAQWMGFHVRRKDNRLSLYDNFVIQLDHIGE
jgi:hypothetical protein